MNEDPNGTKNLARKQQIPMTRNCFGASQKSRKIQSASQTPTLPFRSSREILNFLDP